MIPLLIHDHQKNACNILPNQDIQYSSIPSAFSTPSDPSFRPQVQRKKWIFRGQNLKFSTADADNI